MKNFSRKNLLKIVMVASALFSFSGPLFADFLETEALFHPRYPLTGPFIIEVAGTWSTDCHPGEQRPYVSKYDGESVVIEFDIVVVHVTCNDTPTDYRVLVDMSDVIDTVPGEFDTVRVIMKFGGDRFAQTLWLNCNNTRVCIMDPGVHPDSGLYSAPSLEKQGVLLYRQAESLTVYPLVYDLTGESEWMIAGGRLTNDSFFAELFSFNDGACPDCDPLPDAPHSNQTGRISMLFDATDRVQIKINDGQFAEYRPFVFGYAPVISSENLQSMIDLSGRWAMSNLNGQSMQYPTTFINSVIPQVFDLTRSSDDKIVESPVTYMLVSLEGQEMGELSCELDKPVSCTVEVTEGATFPVSVDAYNRITVLGNDETPGAEADVVRLD